MSLSQLFSSVELDARRAALGLSPFELAAILEVSKDTVLAWEENTLQIPIGIALELETLEDQLDDLAAAIFDLIKHKSAVRDTPYVDVNLIQLPNQDGLPFSMVKVAAARALVEARDSGITATLY